ncbi:hypothetical protein MHI10_21255, partial [Solibacillus sp. FSL K6-1523]|uniref:hypothetical protein n=1 Tax=Solibacillus sp. FSL K6-1523 TaxID=2921471 RepID=UPI0030F95D83
IEVGTVYFDDVVVWTEIDVKTKLTKPDKPKDVLDFKIEFVNGQVELTFKKPTDADYVLIFKNGDLISDKHVTNYLNDKDVKAGKKYTYRVVAVNDGGRSNGLSEMIEIPSKEIRDLRAVTTEKDVELFWSLPVYSDFKTVSIYRKNPSFMASAKSLIPFAKNDDYAPIFVTNGTYFKDLTVAADANYEYKLTTISDIGAETPGVTVKAKTKQVKIKDSELLPTDPENEKGDYNLTWKAPTSGKIKIMMGGKEYKTIDAATLKYTIPAADITFNSLGVPDIKIVPVENGTGREVGPVVIPGKTGFEVDIPLDAENLLGTGVALAGIVGLFLLLGLSFLVVPKLIKTIRLSLEAKKSVKIEASGRRTNE